MIEGIQNFTLNEWLEIAATLFTIIGLIQAVKAYRRSSPNYKKEIAPKLVVTYEITMALSFDDRKIYFRLQNKSVGLAKILSIKSSGHLRPEWNFTGKIILKQNGYKDFVTSPAPLMYTVDLLERRRAMPTFLNELAAELHRVAFSTFFHVKYRDQAGNKFRVTLMYDGNAHFYAGEAIEE